MKRKFFRFTSTVVVFTLLITMSLSANTLDAEHLTGGMQEMLSNTLNAESDMHETPLNPGELSLSELQDRVVPEEDVPEIIGIQTALASKHANRVREQERDLNTVIYQNQDGTNTMYYFPNPVKYVDETGTINDKSNRIDVVSSTSLEKTPYAYASADNDIVTYFPTEITQNGVLLEYENIRIETFPLASTIDSKRTNSDESKKTQAQKSSFVNAENYEQDSIIYTDVFENGIDIRYSLLYEGYKEEIILEKYTGINKFSFRVNIGSLVPFYGDDGSIYLRDENSGETQALISPIVVYDSLGQEITEESLSHRTSDNEMTIKALDDEGNYIVTIIVDEDFLRDEDTAYPVYVDPTITITSSSSSPLTIYDATIYTGESDAYGNSTVLYPGYNGKASRVLFKFPGLTNNATFKTLRADQIRSVKLMLRDINPTSTQHTITAYRSTKGWAESSVTGVSNWNYYTGAMGSQVVYSSNGYANNDGTGSSGYWYPFEISAAVKDWMTSTTYGHRENNYGIMLISNLESSSSSGCKYFASREYTANTALCPRVVLTYSSLSGPTLGIVSGKTYYIRSYYSNLYVDVNNNGGIGAAVVQRPWDGDTSQQWKVSYYTNGLYSFTPLHNTSLRLHVPNANNADGQNLQVRSNTGGDTQYFRIISNSDGTYRFMPMCSTTRVMDIEGPSKTSGAAIQIWTWNSASQMRWYLDDGRILPTPLIGQEESNWCWAACALMAAKTHTQTNVTQSQIVAHVKGSVVNLPATPDETKAAADYALEVSSYSVKGIMSESEVVEKLNAGYPVIILRGWYPPSNYGERDSGHYVIIYGYRIVSGGYEFYIRDPWPVNIGNSYTRTYAYLLNGSDNGRWEYSICR